jgi:hypothetical protein
MNALAQVKDVLKQDKEGKLRRGMPLFDLAQFFFSHGDMKKVGERSTCVLDLMWICNAIIITRQWPECKSEATAHSFTKLDMKHATFTGPIMKMTVEELMATTEAVMWLLDGNVFDDADRDDAWFEEFEQLLEVVRRRAYFLAATPMGPDVHNVEEFANIRPTDSAIMVGNCDSDDETPDVDMEALLARENKQTTQLNEKFVWDMCSMLTHMDVLLLGYKGIQLSWITMKVGEERARIRDSIKDPNTHRSLINYRRDFECELMCNRADKRIYHRKVPLQPFVTPHAVMGAKNTILVDPKNFPMNWEELVKKQGVSRSQYRLSYDAMLCFSAKQTFENGDLYEQSVINALILDDWELQPSLELGPRIIRIRVIQKWGVVLEWPRVYYTDTLIAAYIYLKEQLTHRKRPLEFIVPDDHGALGNKRRKLE